MIYFMSAMVAVMIMTCVVLLYVCFMAMDERMNGGLNTCWGYILPTLIVWAVLTIVIVSGGN